MSIQSSCVRLDEGRWNPKNREVLEKLIEKYRDTNSYAVFDWDNTSIQGDTQLNLFIYQIENLVYKLNPQKFNEVIRKNVPTNNFKERYKNLDGEVLNAAKLANDIHKDYIFLYENYIFDIDLDFRAPEMGISNFEQTIKNTKNLISSAKMVTIATSPYFLDQKQALELIKLLCSKSLTSNMRQK